jgi:hypothetical protein
MQKANNQFNVLQNRLIHVLICAFRNEAVITVTTNVITVTTNVITVTTNVITLI